MENNAFKYLNETKPAILDDLNDFDATSNHLSIEAKVKNLERLKDLDIQKLWLFDAKEKDVDRIFQYIQPRHVALYQTAIEDLSCLENLTHTETLILEWNTKAQKLWDVSKNKQLRNLAIIDFSKLRNIDGLGKSSQLRSLVLEGGMWKPMKLETLEPLAQHKDLEELRLLNIRLKDNSLQALKNLSNLKFLELSNQFPTKEIALLSKELPNTKCKLFQPFVDVEIKDENDNLVYDVMIVGKRKPFLLKSKDTKRIEKYVKEFEKYRQ